MGKFSVGRWVSGKCRWVTRSVIDGFNKRQTYFFTNVTIIFHIFKLYFAPAVERRQVYARKSVRDNLLPQTPDIIKQSNLRKHTRDDPQLVSTQQLVDSNPNNLDDSIRKAEKAISRRKSQTVTGYPTNILHTSNYTLTRSGQGFRDFERDEMYAKPIRSRNRKGVSTYDEFYRPRRTTIFRDVNIEDSVVWVAFTKKGEYKYLL